MIKRRIKRIALFVITALVIFIVFNFRSNRRVILDPGNIDVPHERTINWNTRSVFYDSILNIWAPITVEYGKSGGKDKNPRILLAQLHSKTDIKKTNQIIMGMKPWGVSGSSWPLNKMGDYDFTYTVLTTILWEFGDNPDMLYDETVDHLLNVLLIEEGNNYRGSAPKTLGLIPETENHLLMTEGSRYLKNRWLTLHGSEDSKYDNIGNGMEAKISELLSEMLTKSLYEFNSMPYVGYTITALLNLEAYASDNIRKQARDVLDYMNFCYAIGSYNYKYFPPMRRRYERASWHELTTGYHSIFMKAWMSFLPGTATNFDIGQGKVHAIIGACLPYRPADTITELLFDKGNGYFMKLGHGKNACPEIYSAGEKYLLSAGGANRGKFSQIVPRPITLFIEDSARNLSETFHLSGPGTDFMEWNNTGVHRHFACAAGPVTIPIGYQPVVQNNDWSVYKLDESLSLAVFSSQNLGIMALFEGQEPAEILQDLGAANPEKELLATQFKFPGGSLIEYDVFAPKDLWVITRVDAKPVDRDYDNWPLITGEFEL